MNIPVLEPVSVRMQKIPIAPEFQLMLEPEATILSIGQTPQGEPVFHIRLNPSAQAKIKRTFRLYIPGAALGPGWEKYQYHGTFLAAHPVAGVLNFHCFEVPEELLKEPAQA